MEKMRIALVREPMAHARLAHVACLLGMRQDSPEFERIVHEPWPDPTTRLALLTRDLTLGRADTVLWQAEALPATLPPGVAVGAVVRYGDYGYRCLTAIRMGRSGLSELPHGSTVVVCDPVARAQILCRHPQLSVRLQGPSLETLLEVARGEWDAACVPAEASDLAPLPELRACAVPTDDLIPPVGQGAVALLVPEGGSATMARIRAINDSDLAKALAIERTFLRNVSDVVESIATCHAVLAGGRIDFTGLLAGEDGEWLVRDGAGAAARYGTTIAEEVADGCRELARRERAGIVSACELVAAGAAGR